MADETVVVDLKVIDNMAPSIANLKELKKLLKTLPADSENFGPINRRISDMEDSIKSAKGATSDFVDTLASAPGPLGALGKGLNTLKVSTQSFGAALKATGIGIIVGLLGVLVTAFAKTDGSLKKLEPILIAFEKILGGIVEGMQPFLDIVLELALKALPYLITGTKNIFGAFVSLFTLIKEVGVGAAKILKGLFTFDWKLANEGYEQIKGSWDKTKVAFNQFTDNFDKGYAKQTATQKKNLKDQKEAADKAYDEAVKRTDALNKLDDARIEKAKALALAIATTEQEKLDIEVKFAQIAYDAQKKALEDKIALNKKYGKDTVQLEADLVKLQATFITTQSTNAGKQKDITKNLYSELDAVRKADYEATLMLNKQLSDADKQKLDKALAGGKDFLNAVGKDSKEIQRLLEAYQQDQIVNEITYQQTINKIIVDAATKRYEEANILFESQRADLKKQYEAKLIDEIEYRKKSGEIDKAAAEEGKLMLDTAYQDEINRINALRELRNQAAASEKELLDIRLNSYKQYGDGLSAVFNYISGLQKDASEEQVLLAKIAVYIQSAVALADVILRARAAYASYAKSAAVATATMIEGGALSSNPLTAPVGLAMVAAGSAAKAAAIGGMIATVAGGIAQTAVIATNTALQIQAIDQAASGAAKSSSSGASGGASTPAFSAGGSVGAPQIGASNAQTGVIAGTVAGAINANNSTMQPIKAYVVGNDITTEMQLQRRLRTMARLGG